MRLLTSDPAVRHGRADAARLFGRDSTVASLTVRHEGGWLVFARDVPAPGIRARREPLYLGYFDTIAETSEALRDFEADAADATGDPDVLVGKLHLGGRALRGSAPRRRPW